MKKGFKGFNHITKEYIDEVQQIHGLENKKRHLLEYIGKIVIKNKISEKHLHLNRFRWRVEKCPNEYKFTELLWNSLLSAEGLKLF